MIDRAAAHRQQRSGARCSRSGVDRRREAVHLLQQVPGQRRREPARLLRADALRVARRDDRADHVGVRRRRRSREVRRMTRRLMRISNGLARCSLVGARFALPGRSRVGAADTSRQRVVSRHRRALQVRLGRHRRAVGIPYWIWRVLPTVFADKLPKRPGRGLRAARVHLRDGRAERPADRHVVQSRPRRPRRVQLRDLPRRHAFASRRPARGRSCSACRRIRWTCRATRTS